MANPDEKCLCGHPYSEHVESEGCAFCGECDCLDFHTSPKFVGEFEEFEATSDGHSSIVFPPEGCTLVAHDTGDGWCLSVEDERHNVVAMLAWPKSWPETMSAERLVEFGFEIV